MTQSQSIEGIWEELIKNYSQELTGQRVKITILPEEEPQNLTQAIAEIMAEVNALEVQKPKLPIKKGDDFGEELLEKYRKQGFKL